MACCVKYSKGWRNGQGHTAPVTAMVCVGAGKVERLITASDDKTIKVWLTSSSECIATIQVAGRILDMDVWESTKRSEASSRRRLKSYRLVVALEGCDYVQEIELDEERLTRVFPGAANRVMALTGHGVLATAAPNSDFRLFYLSEQQQQAAPRGQGGSGTQDKLSTGGLKPAPEGSVFAYRFRSFVMPDCFSWTIYPDNPKARDSPLFLVCGGQKKCEVTIYETASAGHEVKQIPLEAGRASPLVYDVIVYRTYKGQTLVFAGMHDKSYVIDANSGDVLQTFDIGCHDAEICKPSKHERVVSMNANDSVQEFNLWTGEHGRRYPTVGGTSKMLLHDRKHEKHPDLKTILFAASKVDFSIKQYQIMTTSDADCDVNADRHYKTASTITILGPAVALAVNMLQLLKFPFSDDFSWSEEVKPVQYVVRVANIEFIMLSVELFYTQVIVVFVLVLIFVLVMCFELPQRISSAQQELFHSRFDSASVRKGQRLSRLKGVIRVFTFLMSSPMLMPVTSTLLNAFDCTYCSTWVEEGGNSSNTTSSGAVLPDHVCLSPFVPSKTAFMDSYPNVNCGDEMVVTIRVLSFIALFPYLWVSLHLARYDFNSNFISRSHTNLIEYFGSDYWLALLNSLRDGSAWHFPQRLYSGVFTTGPDIALYQLTMTIIKIIMCGMLIWFSRYTISIAVFYLIFALCLTVLPMIFQPYFYRSGNHVLLMYQVFFVWACIVTVVVASLDNPGDSAPAIVFYCCSPVFLGLAYIVFEPVRKLLGKDVDDEDLVGKNMLMKMKSSFNRRMIQRRPSRYRPDSSSEEESSEEEYP